MERAFPGARIEAQKGREYDYDLDDPDDAHVAHAAIVGKADAIVTDDTRAGFTTSRVLAEAAIETVTPGEFAANTTAAHPEADLRALVAMSARMTHPAQSPQEILDELATRYEMGEVAEILTPLLPAD